MPHPSRFLPTVLMSFLLIAGTARAQWKSDGIPFCTATGNQATALTIPDGAGGVIVVWPDYRLGAFLSDIYAQRINAAGVPQWATNGVVVCNAPDNQVNLSIASDGAGGVIVAWQDPRSGTSNDIYAQRVNAAGVAQWAANGIVVCNAANEQQYPWLVSDGAGGAIVAWTDRRSGLFVVYAQRLNAAGAAQWTANGLSVCTLSSLFPTMVADGAGGAIVAWQDGRGGANWDIYGQRINSAGTGQWTANGVALCTATNDQTYPVAVTDGASGAIVAWKDRRNGNFDIYAQRVNASGAILWGGGAAVCAATGDQLDPANLVPIVADGMGGALLAWHDPRSGLHHIYAQHMNPNGTPLWTVDGLIICNATNEEGYPSLIADNSGGAIIAWHDGRLPTNSDIYAQHVGAAGDIQWAADGINVGNGMGNQFFSVLCADGAGGAFLVWDDQRLGPDDLYIQRFETRFGLWGHPEPNVTSVADIRNDQGGKVKVNWKASDHDVFNLHDVSFYSVWRGTDVASLTSAPASVMVKSPHDVPRDFSGRAVWKQSGAQATDYYWEWVGNEDAHNRTGYTFTAPTRSDSTLQSTANTYFFVSAQTSNPNEYFDSNVASGHSVDNLAPPAPLSLTAQRTGANVNLKWNRVHVGDLKNYAIYRKTSAGVTPVPVNFLADATDTVLVDAYAGAVYYVVTAKDVHGNQSAASNEASVGKATAAGDLPPITTLSVLQNYPNPFTGETKLQIGLPAKSDVHIDVFDVAGRRVRSLHISGAAAGWRTVPLLEKSDDGRPLASGVYFYRVSAAGSVVTRKMVIAH